MYKHISKYIFINTSVHICHYKQIYTCICTDTHTHTHMYIIYIYIYVVHTITFQAFFVWTFKVVKDS